MRQFAEEEIRIPDGPYEGDRYDCSIQPWAGHWFDAVDSGLWNRFVATGPTQSGKTLTCYIIPLLYHLFEIGEKVIVGLPDMGMANDKWAEDILPSIETSGFADLLPVRGEGSRGGAIKSAVRFQNGATLKFMSGGGSDKKRSAFTARVLVVTETDGMDKPGAASREADKITQLEGRTRSYGARKRVYLECTVSIEAGRTWQEYIGGTKSRILLPCPNCGVYVESGRKEFSGWQTAETVLEARRGARFGCPECGVQWTDEQRAELNHKALLVHDGQQVVDGRVEGLPKEADTLGFRYSAVNNLLVTAGDVGVDEWKASRRVDEDSAEKEMLQFVWALPVVPDALDVAPLDARVLCARQSGYARGIVPPDTKFLTIGIDCAKWLCHWVLIAWADDATGFIVDYGVIEVQTRSLGVERGLTVALHDFRDQIMAGWPVGATDERRVPDQVWIDSGYQTDVIYGFCREVREGGYDRFRPTKGFGETQQLTPRYGRPKTTGKLVRFIGQDFHIVVESGVYLVHVNADAWKSWLHERLSVPIDQAGALTIYEGPPQQHLTWAKHMVAEKQVEEFVAGRGSVTTWQTVGKHNHYFDAGYNACAASWMCGARLIGERKAEPKPRTQAVEPAEDQRFTTPDGRPFFIGDR